MEPAPTSTPHRLALARTLDAAREAPPTACAEAPLALLARVAAAAALVLPLSADLTALCALVARQAPAETTRAPPRDRLSTLPDALFAAVCSGLHSRELCGAPRRISRGLYERLRACGTLVHVYASSYVQAARLLPARRWGELASLCCGYEDSPEAEALLVAPRTEALLGRLGPRLKALHLFEWDEKPGHVAPWPDVVGAVPGAVWPGLHEFRYVVGTRRRGGLGTRTTSFPGQLPELRRLALDTNYSRGLKIRVARCASVLAAAVPGRLREMTLAAGWAYPLLQQAVAAHAPHLELLSLRFDSLSDSRARRTWVLPPLPAAHTLCVTTAGAGSLSLSLAATAHPNLRHLVAEGSVRLMMAARRRPRNGGDVEEEEKERLPKNSQEAAESRGLLQMVAVDMAVQKKEEEGEGWEGEEEQVEVEAEEDEEEAATENAEESVASPFEGAERKHEDIGAWSAPALETLRLARKPLRSAARALSAPGGHGPMAFVHIGNCDDGLDVAVDLAVRMARGTARTLEVRRSEDFSHGQQLDRLVDWPHVEELWLSLGALPLAEWWEAMAPALSPQLRAIHIVDNAGAARPKALPARVEWRADALYLPTLSGERYGWVTALHSPNTVCTRARGGGRASHRPCACKEYH